ncbi:MAG: hypothetical protein JO187_10875 [Acidobacteria bacterium]|nr:hypothetical protein [Acidobacteriota bacterium]
MFSGRIECDGRIFEGDPLGFGVQGHNCGYRHRTFWNWTHVFFPRAGITPSTLEALVYDMPLGVVFRKAVLWHDGREYVFRELRETAPESGKFCWEFACGGADARLNVMIDGSVSPVHRLPYLKTDCSGTFDVLNNSLAQAKIMIDRRGTPSETLETATGAVLEMGGQR